MAGMFRGVSVHKVDSKGRVSIPASFRTILISNDPEYSAERGATVTIVFGNRKKRELECYSEKARIEVDEKIEMMPRGSKSRRMLERMFTTFAHTASVDENGRLVLSSQLRAHAGIGDKAVFMASGDTFLILSEEEYDARVAELEDWQDEIGDDVDPLSFLEAYSNPPGTAH